MKQEILKAGDRLVALAMVFALSFITLPMWASTNKIDAKNELTQADLKKTITGIVYDSQGEPLIGANVLEQGTQNGTITDIDGRFSLSVTEGGKLTVSYIGFDAQVINITSSNTYKITLKEDVGLLDEVVVVGYGIQKRSDLTGAISSVKSSELPSSATTSVEHMLAGKVAGMQVRAVDAQPGGGISILIRGAASVGASNEPLYVIDGFPVGGVEDPGTGNDRYSSTDARRSPLNSINPNDIESIEVLKDASATSIYGARAANGVVLITTKKGKLGKVEVAYDTKFGVQSMKNDWKVMNATELMHTRNRFAKENWMDKNGIGVYGGNDPSDANSPFRPTYTEEEILAMGKGTNWMKEVSRTGITQEHNVSVSGASERSNHLISINYFDQEGILRNNNFNRITARANLSQNIASWLRVGINATGSRIKYDNPTLGGGSGEYKGTNENSGMMEAARIFSPLLPVKDSDGNYTTMEESKFLPNPMSLMEIYSKTKQNRIFAQSYVEFMPLEGMMVRGQFGIDKQDSNTKMYLPKSTFQGAQSNGKAHINHANRFDKLLNLTVSYKRTIAEKHTLDGLLGYEWQRLTRDGYSMEASDFSSEAINNADDIGTGKARPSIGSYRSSTDVASYFGRINYNYADRYLLTFTLRADGSDKFGSNNQWGYFPSGAFAWRIEQEDFMKNLDFISNAKLRLSVGQTGNSDFSGNAFAYYRTGRDYLFGNQQNTGIYLDQNGNPSLKWETTTEYNLGLDLGFLKNRINFGLELYTKRISGLLGSSNKPYYFPVNYVAANIGKTSSRGFEINLNTVNFQGEFTWTSNLNLSRYVDKWVKRNPDVVLNVHQSTKDPLRPIWGYQLGGILQPGDEVPAHMPGAKPGAQIIQDIGSVDDNGNRVWIPDGKIGNEDLIMLGTSDPDLIFGFTNSFEYKGFDLNIHVYGSLGWKRHNDYLGSMMDLYSKIDDGRNYPAYDQGKFWSSENPNGKYPNLFVSGTTAPGRSQFAIESADFLKVRNITLGYTFNNIKGVDKYFKNLRVYVDVGNPFTWTKFSKIDPEYTGTYPSATTYTFGLNVKF